MGAALATLLAACGAGASGPDAAANVAYDDNASVVVAGALVGQDLDPYKAGGVIEGIIDIYDPLIRPKADLTVEPGLATSWEWSPDNLKLTLTLRQGVTFSDGTPFDSSAVIASLNRARTGATSTQKATLATITDVSADGPGKAVITVSQPNPALVSILSSPAGMPINPKLVGNDDAVRAGAPGVGTGPYTVDRFQPTTQMVLKKRTDYWDAASTVHAPVSFTFNFSNDGNARLNGLKSGQYQAVQSTGTPGLNGPGALADVDKHYAVTRAQGFPSLGITFAFAPPFDNPLVRQAISHAINFDALAGLFSTQMGCAPGRDTQLIRKGQLGYDPNAKGSTYDLDLAKRQMAQAGYPDGKGFPPVVITSSTASQDVVAAQAFQPELAKIGIQMSINTQPSRAFLVAQLAGGKAQMATLNLPNGAGIDPSLGYNIGVLGQPPFVDVSTPAGTQYKNLIAQAAVAPDTAVRSTLYRQAEQIAQDNAFYIPFCRGFPGYAHTSKLSGFANDFWLLYGALKASSLTITK